MWTSKIVSHAKIKCTDVQLHPLNYRTHSEKQQEIVRDSLTELGIVQSIVINRMTGRLIDGHARVGEACKLQAETGQDVFLDAEYVELSEKEELQALLLLDGSGALARQDRELIGMLVDGMTWETESLSAFQRELTVHYANDGEWGGKKDADIESIKEWSNDDIKRLVKVAIPVERWTEVAGAVNNWLESAGFEYRVIQ
jgi:hypothetical protein